MNHSKDHDVYWSQSDRVSDFSCDLQQVADEILLSCGSGAILDVGSGEGALVFALLEKGVNAVGVDVSTVIVARANERAPGKFFEGSVLALPFDDGSFETVVSTDCMERLSPEDVPTALREIYRVARNSVFLRIATTQDCDSHWHLTVEGRTWWEAKCFEVGFRKHPAYYKVNDYESLNGDGWQICILLEKLPRIAADVYPLESLSEERGLHMDMLRDGGERSDAHVIRYHWASSYVRPGDRVLDAACGLGYGGRVIQANTRADKISGIDGSEYAIEYAKKSFPADRDHRLIYELGMLPEALVSFADGSVDLITSFETLEHVPDPISLLREFHRILAPGGRILVSIPNDWSDESGEDPNPYHLHVYDWTRLKAEISQFFILEAAYAQTASQCKVPTRGKNVWERRGRLLRQVELTASAPIDCEWWLMVGMKSPVEASSGYEERVFQNIAHTRHPSIRYGDFFSSPWLMHSMVNITHRLKNGKALGELCGSVMKSSFPGSNDYKAALCVRTYLLLNQHDRSFKDVQNIIRLIDCEVRTTPIDEMAFRWRVSLLFVKGKLLQVSGELTVAIDAFAECASHDVRVFGVHLATKTTEACFLAGRIALSTGNTFRARSCWEQGVEIGNQLLGVSLDDILINRGHPNFFNHGDGVREYTVAWDNIARCANGLALLAGGCGVDEALLQGCFQTEYAVVTRDLVTCRTRLDEVALEIGAEHRLLEERTELVTLSNAALEGVTQELVEARADLVERTAILEKYVAEQSERTGELVSLRQELVDRTQRLENRNAECHEITQDLVSTRQQLVERTKALEDCNAALVYRTDDLVLTRHQLVERTELLTNADLELVRHIDVLAQVSGELSERSALLEQAVGDLSFSRSGLARVTDQLWVAGEELKACSSELADAREELRDNQRQLQLANEEIVRLSQSVFMRIWMRIRQRGG